MLQVLGSLRKRFHNVLDCKRTVQSHQTPLTTHHPLDRQIPILIVQSLRLELFASVDLGTSRHLPYYAAKFEHRLGSCFLREGKRSRSGSTRSRTPSPMSQGQLGTDRQSPLSVSCIECSPVVASNSVADSTASCLWHVCSAHFRRPSLL